MHRSKVLLSGELQPMCDRLESPIHRAFDPASDAKRSHYRRLDAGIPHELGDTRILHRSQDALEDGVHRSGRLTVIR